MINVFRKEMKKWSTILWVVLLSFAFSSLAVLFYRAPSEKTIKVATVDGSPVFYNEYQTQLFELQSQIEMFKQYARSQGVSPEWLLTLYGLNKPQEKALDAVVVNALLNRISDNFNLQIAPKFFAGSLARTLPRQLLREDGSINEDMYREYLNQRHMSVSDYETQKEQDVKRNLVKTIADHSLYVPRYHVDFVSNLNNQTKSFSVLNVPFDRFLDQVKKEAASDEDLRAFYDKNKEMYRVAEKRKAKYFVLDPDVYEKAAVVKDSNVEAFYEKNKTDLFRIAPEVKVRKIVAADRELADKIYQEVLNKKDQAANIAKKMGATSREVDFFKRGTYDSNSEFEKAAFRLKEKDEISPVIQTEEGFEIVQLIERKPAEYKPLEMVRDEIAKTLKAKKAFNALRSDLATVVYDERSENGAIDKFAKEKGLKAHETGWLTMEDSRGDDTLALVASNLFNKKSKQTNFGYFADNGKYVLFVEVGREKSKIPTFKDIKEKVLSDYNNKQARKKEKAFVNTKRQEVLSGKSTLAKIAAQENFSLTKTGLLDKDAKFPHIESKDATTLAFELNDQSQVLKLKDKKDFYLIQLDKINELKSEGDKQEKMQKVLKSEEDMQKTHYLNAFIASLLRNAKIEKYKKFLN